MKVLLTDSMTVQYLDLLKATVGGDVEWISAAGNGEALLKQLADVNVFVGSPFTAEMSRVADSLQLIQLTGAGTGGVDFESLRDSVVVANTYHHERSIAEYVLMCMLALSRRLRIADAQLRQGSWYAVRHDGEIPLPQTLEGCAVGIVGFGHIGQQVARLATCLSMRVSAIKREPDAETAESFGLSFLGRPDDLGQLLEESDFLVLAAPLTDETRGLIDAEALAKMKRTAFLINVARGPIVDEAALYEAVAGGQIAGAAIDTWYQYPGADGQSAPASFPFQELDNVIMTPHTSGETAQTVEARMRDIAANIKFLIEGQPLRNVVDR